MNAPYYFLRADGVPVAQPLFQTEGDGASPISALQLHFAPIGTDTALSLNALWHSVLPQLSKTSFTSGGLLRIAYAAEFDNSFYAVALWSTPPAVNRMRWTSDEVLELRRFAIADQAPKNTASRMLAWMVRDLPIRFPSLRMLISYQSLEHHAGTIYKASGWSEGPRVEFRPWAHDRSNGGATPQTFSDKVRWERQVGEES